MLAHAWNLSSSPTIHAGRCKAKNSSPLGESVPGPMVSSLPARNLTGKREEFH